MNTLILNTNNVIGQNKNLYRYSFPQGGIKIKENTRICLSSLTIPYSWFNISSSYSNNTISFSFPQTGSQPTYTVNIQDGFYTVSDLNYYLQQYFIANSFYLINSAGINVYYISLQYNPTYYAIQAVLTVLPTSLPVGWSQPSGWRGFPLTTTLTPQLIVNNSGISKYLGFTQASYPTTPQTSSQSFLSNETPIGSNVNSLTIRCSLITNKLSFPSDLLDSVPISSNFGSNITYEPSFEKFISCSPGQYNNLDVLICDENFNNIQMKDSNVVITLLIKED